MDEAMSRRWVVAVSTILVVCGCGDGDRTPGQSSGSGIGPAGGTVTGPSGAQVVIPPGALSASTPIAVAQTSSGLPPLPAGVVPFGPMFAFTPHGTSFAVPVSITVPFDPALAPPGTQPVLYKTNPAMTGWAAVPSATASGGKMTGTVRSFSGLVVGPPPPPPLEKGTPFKSWDARDYRRDHTLVLPFRDQNQQDGGVLERDYDFGPGTMLDPGVPLPDLLPREFRSSGRIFSSPGGGIYGVYAEAPIGHQAQDLGGNFLNYHQTQSYRKRTTDAKLHMLITQARIEAYDDGSTELPPCDFRDPECAGEMNASIDFTLAAHSTRLPKLFRGAGSLRLRGWRSHWIPDTKLHALPLPDGGIDAEPLWNDDGVAFAPDLGLEEGSQARLSLKTQLLIPIDLSNIDVGEEFTVHVDVSTYVFDGRTKGEFSYLGAFFRDPTRIDGDPQLIAEGLDPTDRPEPLPPSDDPSLPAECRGLPSAGALEFFSPSYEVFEGAGAAGVDLLVLRIGGSTGQVGAKVTTSDGTATAPGDYQSVQTTVTFEDGDTSPKLIKVPLVYSPAAEGDKTLTVNLTEPTGCATLGQASSVVTIIDDTHPLPQSFTLGGTVSGLLGTGLVLRDVLEQQTLAVGSNGTFVFPTARVDGRSYDVRVDTQPGNPLQACTVANGTGAVSGGNVTSITVTCATPVAPGGLDPSFGDSGRVVTSVGYSPSLLGARIGMALQSDEKILLVGGLKLLRLNVDGTMDTTFGTAGVVNVVFDNGVLDTAMDVAVQADGKIVVAGTGSTSTVVVGSDNFALTRFNPDGSLDTTFGNGGHVTTDFFGSTDQVRRMGLQPDGKILVVGFAVQPISATRAPSASPSPGTTRRNARSHLLPRRQDHRLAGQFLQHRQWARHSERREDRGGRQHRAKRRRGPRHGIRALPRRWPGAAPGHA